MMENRLELMVVNVDELDTAQKLDTILERFIRGMRVHFPHSDASGLTRTQIYVMRYLRFVEHAKSSEIARVAGLSPGAITQVCDELVRLKYVDRDRSNADRRVVYVTLTDLGRQQLKALVTERAQRLGELMDKLGEDDASELLRLLERLVEIMDSEPTA